MNKKLPVLVVMVLIIGAVMIPSLVFGKGPSHFSTKPDPAKIVKKEKPPVFQNVSVHDPSVMQANNGDYYVFGTHITAAKSKDLMSWTDFSNGYTTPNNQLFGDLAKNLAGSFAWAGDHDGDNPSGYSVWAPDVFYDKAYVNSNGKKGAYIMYYCTSSTYKRSAIGYAVSQNVEGPYTYVDTIMYSGFTKMSNYDGQASGGGITLNNQPTSYSKINTRYTNTNIQQLIKSGKISGPSDNWFNTDGSYNTSNAPNAIDPTVFPDKKGKLWMVYGSWSGGLYVLPINSKTGKPIYPGKDGTTTGGNHIDRYFGTKISGGYGESGEGPYIIYDKDTNYYYLYESLGGLASDGGYNMRVYRSKQPDGPYLDPDGKNAVLPNAQANNADYGEKLMGNFLFDRQVGDPGSGLGVGYVSPGGNSVLYDKKTGKKFIVFHSRFPEQGEYHEVRVQQIFMNKEGWPVVSPYRYAGESLEKVNRQSIVGDYKFINHGKATTKDIETPVTIHLNKNNKITGSVTGTWKKVGQNQAEINIDGGTYNGVFVRDWDPVSEDYVMTFTAVSKAGITIWGSRETDMSDETVVKAVYDDLSLGDTSQVIANLTLPTEGTHDSQIKWQSSDPNVVSDSGVIHRPDAGSNPVSATLTATITKGSVTKTKEFSMTVLPYEPAGMLAEYDFEGNLNETNGKFLAGTVTGDKLDNTGGSITYAQGENGQAAVFDGKSGIRLPNGLISGNTYSVSLWIKPEQLTEYTTTFFGAEDTNHWISLVPDGPLGGNPTELWSGSASWYDANVGSQVPIGSWTNLIFTVDNGTVNVFVNGEKAFSGVDFPNIFTDTNASFGLGVNYWDPPFKGMMDDLRIYSGALTPAQISRLSRS
ncbi:glycoside hydrolase family 43 C-terminal domain-containing protein [Pullulanibacillus sp. KACC 23026]|uniref:LamG-like jellyroll fold domain-containing protein n=1 Tax=Pullulanibacillus sp. KACC 23026 TaxID=3028315 RepID=UPI0023B1FB24|nr:LamG-like jellyroll fold domain-containing protein [Pullulanibacillus sp. KACC 23026]WEG11096.1 glycoside hydrolase family 43 C-terminal domain-containing protein [Pullulanibacillus sp. KACC 23026]